MQPTFFDSPAELRDWFEKNHDEARELLIGLYKAKSGKGGITYQQALDEALCFGWIDGVRKSLGAEAWTIRFTPRKRSSVWSAVNIKRVHELSSLGLMRPAGLAAFETRDERMANQYSYEQKTVELDPAYEQRLRENADAWDFFDKQAPSYKRACFWWVMSAKREETRLSRLATLIEDSKNGRRVRPLTPPAARRKSSDCANTTPWRRGRTRYEACACCFEISSQRFICSDCGTSSFAVARNQMLPSGSFT